MYNILCFGDSNTFGYDAIEDGRFPWGVRWTSLVQEMLGESYRVIEEGMGGRTTVWDDPVENFLSGKSYLNACLESHWPLDLVLIMLGTNDLKVWFGQGAYGIACGVERLVCMTRDYLAKLQTQAPEILIVSPIEVGEGIVGHPYEHAMGGKTAVERSREFPRYYRLIAKRQGCHYMAASEAAAPCKEDSIHLDADGHRKLAEAVVKKIREIAQECEWESGE